MGHSTVLMYTLTVTEALTGAPPLPLMYLPHASDSVVATAGPIGTTPPAPPAGTQQQKEKGPPPLALGMTICAIDGGLNFIQGGVVGSAFGAFMGSSEAFQAGLR